MWQQQQQHYAPQEMQALHHHHHHHHHHQQQQPVNEDQAGMFVHQHPIAAAQLPPPPQQCSRMNSPGVMDVAVAHASNPRASRNMAEKQRRDNLNTQIAAMASLVPTVSTGGSRKKDKISVLRLTAAHLRVAYTLGVRSNQFLPPQFNDIDLESCLIDNLAGSSTFLLVLTTTGKIIYISRHVEQLLGHEQIDMIGDSLYNYVYSEDQDELTRGLSLDQNCLSLTATAPPTTSSDSLEETSNSSEDSASKPEYSDFREQRRTFNVRLAQRTNSRRERVHHEYTLISGMLRLAHECRIPNRPRRENSSTSNDIIFVGTGRLLKHRSITEIPLLEANKNEYFTRHLIDGRIIFCDHRISVVAGYMSEEVSGTSAFRFMHKDDVRWTIVALRDMYDHGKSCGSSCYRLVTKTGEFIYLRTHGYLEYDDNTQVVSSFICINTLTSQEEGEELIADMKKRFSATIDGNRAIRGFDDGFESESECSSTSHGLPTLEDASLLEDAISHLLSDLPQPVLEDRSSPSPLPNAQYYKAAMYSQRLPPASIQASRIGIKDIENAYASYGKDGKGKGGKGKPNSKALKDVESDSNNRSPKSAVGRAYPEKKMPELDDPSSPSATSISRPRVPIAEKVFPPVNGNGSSTNPDIIQVEEALKIPQTSTNNVTACTGPPDISSPYVDLSMINTYTNLDIQPDNNSQRRTSLKRRYDCLENTEIPSKKRAVDNGLNEDVIIINKDNTCIDVEFSECISTTSRADAQKMPVQFKQQLDDNTIAVSAEELINCQDTADEQLLNCALESNPELMKFLNGLPTTMDIDEEIATTVLQYPTSDQGAVVENEVRRAHLQLADSITSDELQFNNIDDSEIVNQCDNFQQPHTDHKVQNQKVAEMQLNVHHDIGV